MTSLMVERWRIKRNCINLSYWARVSVSPVITSFQKSSLSPSPPLIACSLASIFHFSVVVELAVSSKAIHNVSGQVCNQVWVVCQHRETCQRRHVLAPLDGRIWVLVEVLEVWALVWASLPKNSWYWRFSWQSKSSCWENNQRMQLMTLVLSFVIGSSTLLVVLFLKNDPFFKNLFRKSAGLVDFSLKKTECCVKGRKFEKN